MNMKKLVDSAESRRHGVSSGDLHVWPGPGTGLMEPETPNWKDMNHMIEDDSVIHGELVTATWGE